MHDLRITLLQSDLHWEDPERNRMLFAEMMDRMAEPADLILLPETFNTGFSMKPEAMAESMEGPSVAFLLEQARKREAVICGSLLIAANGRYFNRFVAAFPDGTTAHYDKRHLFCLSDESAMLAKGGENVVFSVKGWKVRPQVCYDLRFPVWARNKFREGRFEYDLLVYVANWPESRNGVWQTLLRARSMENQCYVAGVNRVGRDGAGTNHAGESMIIDPKGRIMNPVVSGEPAISSAVLSFDELNEFRKSFPVGNDWDDFHTIP